jgi:hypothetical protein
MSHLRFVCLTGFSSLDVDFVGITVDHDHRSEGDRGLQTIEDCGLVKSHMLPGFTTFKLSFDTNLERVENELKMLGAHIYFFLFCGIRGLPTKPKSISR